MSKEKTIIVNNKKTGLIGFEDVTIMPGPNTISEVIAKKMQSHPVIKIMIEEGQLEFPEHITEELGVSKLSPNEAIALVETTVDSDLLKSWVKSDERKPVKVAIEKQLKKLSEPTQLRGGNKSENK